MEKGILKQFIDNQYQNLFVSNAGEGLAEVLSCVSPRVTQEMNEALMVPFSGDEIYKALDSIGDLIGEKVTSEVLAMLNGGDMPNGWNDTIIVIISKVKEPKRLKDLRPISLCTVLYKFISKVLANRLKDVLPTTISATQSAFVQGRLIAND